MQILRHKLENKTLNSVLDSISFKLNFLLNIYVLNRYFMRRMVKKVAVEYSIDDSNVSESKIMLVSYCKIYKLCHSKSALYS